MRHRVVTCLSRSHLEQEIKKLTKEGWRVIGEPALAAPFDLNRPPYWAQTMYLGPATIITESVRIEPPAESKVSNGIIETNGP